MSRPDVGILGQWVFKGITKKCYTCPCALSIHTRSLRLRSVWDEGRCWFVSHAIETNTNSLHCFGQLISVFCVETLKAAKRFQKKATYSNKAFEEPHFTYKWSEVKCVYVVTQLDSAVPHQPTMTAHWCRGHHNHTGPWPSWHPWRAAVTAPWRAWPASGWMRRRRQGQRLRRMPVQTERRGTQGWGRRRQRSGVHWQH